MAELKQSRWVKIHEPGQANFDEKENIMDIVVGSNRCQAGATFTVRNHKKAAYWLLRYLEAADAAQILTQIADQIQQAADDAGKDDDEVKANGETWSCEIEKLAHGVYKVQLMWTTDEPVTKRKTTRTRKSKKTAA